MNVNFGLFPPLEEAVRKGRKGKRERAMAYSARALAAVERWIGESGGAQAAE